MDYPIFSSVKYHLKNLKRDNILKIIIELFPYCRYT
jgi:hypothetical protein